MAGKRTSLGRLVLLGAVAAAVWGLQQAGYLSKGTGKGGAGPEPVAEGAYAWIEHRQNDGDSFRVRGPDGREEEIRLYYVDAPEAALKRYANGDTNHARVDEQARDLGLEREAAVAVGQEAGEWVRETLRGRKFTVFTRGEKVYDGPRIYGFVRVEVNGGERWLHELLVERGLVRIHTKGAPLPDGTPTNKQLTKLRELEREAKRRKAGAWGMR